MDKFLKALIGDQENEASNIDYTLFSDQIQLANMNKEHAFINSLGGRPCVMCNIYDETLNKDTLEFISSADLKIRYCNVFVHVASDKKSLTTTPLGKYWVEHPNRRNYLTVVFDPKKPHEFAPNPQKPNDLVYNLWEGLSIVPKKGTWKKMRKHIWAVVCNKDKVKFKYVMRWFAWTMQNVHDRAEVALVLKGKQGSGKGILLSQFEKVFGPHYMSIASSDHLTGKFNAHLRKTVFLFADEAYDPKDRESEGKLKQLITEPSIPIEAKFKDTVLAKNRLHIVMATNNARVIVAGEDSRRFFINEVDNKWAKGQGKSDDERAGYFTPIWREMDQGGREAMIWDFQQIKLGEWHPRTNVPETEEMRNQRRLQFNEVNAVLEWFELGEFPGKFDGYSYIVKSSTLEKHMREKIPSLKDPRMISWKRILSVFEKVGISKENQRIKRLSNGVHITMEELHVMRRAWDMSYPAYLGNWDHVKKPDTNDKKELDYYYASKKWIELKDAF